MKKIKRERSTSTTGHYVRNADLLPAVIEAKQLGVVTNKLITMIQMIAERYSKKGSFGGYSFREDMVASAVENLCKNALKFNHEKYNNPFAFYTTAIHHSFLQYMAEEKKHRNIRDQLLLDAGQNPSFNYLEKENDEDSQSVKESDEMQIRIIDDESEASTEEYQESTIKKDEDSSEEKIVAKELKIRYRDRAPGPVTKYGPGDYEIDPITGAFILKKKEEPAVFATAEKKQRKPRTTSAAAKKTAVSSKKPADKKVVAKKAVAKKPAVKAVAKKAPAKSVAKKVAKTTTKTKPAAKKPAVKKVQKSSVKSKKAKA